MPKKSKVRLCFMKVDQNKANLCQGCNGKGREHNKVHLEENTDLNYQFT